MFGDRQPAEILRRIKAASASALPRAAGEQTGLDRDVGGDGQRTRIGLRGRRHGPARESRVGAVERQEAGAGAGGEREVETYSTAPPC